MPSDTILVENRNAFTHITLNRPTIGNALNAELIEALSQALEKAAADSDSKGIILTGAGERFCTGGDLTFMRSPSSEVQKFFDTFVEVLDRLANFPRFTAALVNGHCLGGGFGLALCCDYVIASSQSQVGTPEITKGLFPYMIYPVLRDKIGAHRAAAFAYGGKMLSATDAFSWGLFSEVCSEAEFDRRTQELLGNWSRMSRDNWRHAHESQSFSLGEKRLARYLFEMIEGLKNR